MKPESVRRILVVKPSSLGDVLHAFPAVELLYKLYPEAQLDWLIHPAFAELLDFSPFPVSNKIFFNRKKLSKILSGWLEIIRLIGDLRCNRYDLVIDMQGLFRSSFFAFCTKGASPIGFANPRESISKYFYGVRYNVDMKLHAIERNVALVAAFAGLDTKSYMANCKLTLPENKSYQPPIPEYFAGRRLIGIVPGARWESKVFPAKLFVEVMKSVAKVNSDVGFLIIGATSESSIAEDMVSVVGDCACSLAGKTSLGEMVELIRRCECVVGNDSGPLHVASALGRKVYAFFGSTDPQLTRPYGTQNRIYQLDLECICCMKRECTNSENPLACHNLDANLIADDIIIQLSKGV